MDGEHLRWEKRFATEDYAFGEKPSAFLSRQQPLLPTKRKALAVSDGEGRNGVWLAEQGLDVTAFDFSPRGVYKARPLAARHGVNIDVSVADIYTYPWPLEIHDAIIVISTQYMGPKQRDQVFSNQAASCCWKATRPSR
jgi:2-polyprenyl-3-methyl-5-hydroxy-6-metoxy-1,4-benzoquinol methylase